MMEIPELSMFNEFEVLQNPSLFSRFFSLAAIGEVLQLYSFSWKWGALVLALVATLPVFMTRIKLLIIRFVKSLDSSVPPIKQFLCDSASDDDEDDSSSTASSADEEYLRLTSFNDRQPIVEDFSVAASCGKSNNLRFRNWRSRGDDRFSWSDFASGKSVVKLWDKLGLEFDFEEDSSESVVSIWDLNRDQKISSFSGGGRQIPAVSISSPAVVFSAGSSNNNVLLAAYDTRIGGQNPSMYAEWLPRRGKVVDIDFGGVEKAYIRDDVTGKLTVGDLRKIKSPLEDPAHSDGEIWWDADAVIGSDEFVGQIEN